MAQSWHNLFQICCKNVKPYFIYIVLPEVLNFLWHTKKLRHYGNKLNNKNKNMYTLLLLACIFKGWFSHKIVIIFYFKIKYCFCILYQMDTIRKKSTKIIKFYNYLVCNKIFKKNSFLINQVPLLDVYKLNYTI